MGSLYCGLSLTYDGWSYFLAIRRLQALKNAGRRILSRDAHRSARKISNNENCLRAFFFLFFILHSNRHVSHGIQSRLAKLPEFILDKRNHGGGKKEKKRKEGIKEREREWLVSLIHAGAHVIPRPRHILTSFRVTLCFSKMVGAHVAARRRRGGWFISNTQSHPLPLSLSLSFSLVLALYSPYTNDRIRGEGMWECERERERERERESATTIERWEGRMEALRVRGWREGRRRPSATNPHSEPPLSPLAFASSIEGWRMASRQRYAN